MEMRALVVRDFATGAELLDLTVAPPKGQEVLVRMEASGICGSDLKFLDGQSHVGVLPTIMGHEGAGTVAEVGPEVTEFRPGDSVAVAMGTSCGACPSCARQQLHLCSNPDRELQIEGRMADGTSRFHLAGMAAYPFVGSGTLAEYVVASARKLVKVPQGVPLESAAISACGVVTGLGAALNIARPEPGSSALIIGCGGVGLSVVQGCRIAGSTRIVAVDTNISRLDTARRVGATDVIDAGSQSVADAVRSLFPAGVDYAFEASGVVANLEMAFSATRRGGSCVAVASYPPGARVGVDAWDLFWDRRLRGCVAGNSVPRHDLPRIFDLFLAGQLDLEALTAGRWCLADVHDAIDASRRGEVPRAVVTFP
jgi:S-(hydroxymethyl)glutathione dehydrogenase / alcohol dehydrogenase